MSYYGPENNGHPVLETGTMLERAVLKRYKDHIYPGTIRRKDSTSPEQTIVEKEHERRQALLAQLEYVASAKSPFETVNIVIQGACMTPYEAFDDLAAVQGDLLHATGNRPVRLHHLTQMVPDGREPAHLAEGSQYGLIDEPWFVSPTHRRAVAEGRAAYTPAPLETIGRLLEIGEYPIDMVLFQMGVDQSNLFQYGSIGSSVDVTLPAIMQVLERRRDGDRTSLFAYENTHGIIAHGATGIYLPDIDVRAQIDRPLLAAKSSEIDPTSFEIARNIAKKGFILDGSVIQLGIGSIPEAVAVLMAQGEVSLMDLAASTELLGDGHLMLLQKGMLTNRFRPDFPGKTLYSFANGTQAVLDFIHNNPEAFALPSTVINSSIYKVHDHAPFISINGALEVGIDGANSESPVLGQIHSGRGGAGDFTRIGRMFGHALLALPSTWTEKTAAGPQLRSRIVPYLNGPTSIAEAELDTVITEHGVARMKMMSRKERLIRLIGITHPDFRGELMKILNNNKTFLIG